MPIDLVVVDVTGTITTDADRVARVLGDSLRAHNVAIGARELCARMGPPKRAVVRGVLAAQRDGGAASDRDVDLVHLHFAHRMLRIYRSDPGPVIAPGAAEALVRVRRAGAFVVLATGFDRIVSVGLEGALRVRSAGIADGWLGAEDVDDRGEDLVAAAMRLAGVADPARVAVVGDTRHDLARAARAGAGLVVGVTRGLGTRAELAGVRGARLCASVAELPALLDDGGAGGPGLGGLRLARAS